MGKGGGELRFSVCGRSCVGVRTHLPSYNHDASICRPRDGESFPSELDSRYAGFCPHVPESAGAVGGDGGEFGFLGWVPGYALDSPSVAAQLGAVFHLRLFGIPDT